MTQSAPDALDEDTAACARCGAVRSGDDLTVWSHEARLRVFCPNAKTFKYVRRRHHHAVCWPCHAQLAKGGGLIDVKNRRAVIIMICAVVFALIVAALTPLTMPTLLSAFWLTH